MTQHVWLFILCKSSTFEGFFFYSVASCLSRSCARWLSDYQVSARRMPPMKPWWQLDKDRRFDESHRALEKQDSPWGTPKTATGAKHFMSFQWYTMIISITRKDYMDDYEWDCTISHPQGRRKIQFHRVIIIYGQVRELLIYAQLR